MNLDALADALASDLEGKVTRDEPLARFTTYRLGGPASVYVEPSTRDDVDRLARILAKTDSLPPILLVGRGSNLVISDAGWPGIAIRLGPRFSFVETAARGLRAGGATALPLLANWAARRGLAGLEFTIAIPGSVGGAVRMNAGAHGTEIKDRLINVLVFDLEECDLADQMTNEFDFGYRHSNLVATDLVLEATFELAEEPAAQIRSRMESFRRHRSETQPGAVQNAGSVFRNPPGDHAGRLVESAGLKGFSIGGARVSELHGNFFIAESGAKAQDVFDLVAEVGRRVDQVHGARLIPEIRFVGPFRDHSEGVEST